MYGHRRITHMAKMYPKQAVDIVQTLLSHRVKNNGQDPLGLLSPKQGRAVTFLADFVDEVRRARDLVSVIDRLFEEGVIYEQDKLRSKKGRR
jgi:hypothetical protein